MISQLIADRRRKGREQGKRLRKCKEHFLQKLGRRSQAPLLLASLAAWSCCPRTLNSGTICGVHSTGQISVMRAVCGKSFAWRFTLVEHLYTHTGKKPFCCPDCNKCFDCSSSLSMHQAVHQGEWPYSCPNCGQAFTHHFALTTHLRVYAGETPYCCVDCGRCFRESSGLYQHQMVVHSGMTPFTCTHYGRAFAHIFDATSVPTRVKSLIHALTVDAASFRPVTWQLIGRPIVASVPTPALSVAGALARSQM